MKKASKKTGICLLLGAVFIVVMVSWKTTPKLLQKVKAAISFTYKVETTTQEPILVPLALQKSLALDYTENRLFKIIDQSKLIGYGYLGEAASMKRKFDYIVLFNPELSIVKAKVLIYREDHGRQIGSQRWLKQFIGLAPTNELIYGENIDAISGATISASSMTKAVDALLHDLKEIKSKDLL